MTKYNLYHLQKDKLSQVFAAIKADKIVRGKFVTDDQIQSVAENQVRLAYQDSALGAHIVRSLSSAMFSMITLASLSLPYFAFKSTSDRALSALIDVVATAVPVISLITFAKFYSSLKRSGSAQNDDGTDQDATGDKAIYRSAADLLTSYCQEIQPSMERLLPYVSQTGTSPAP